MVLAKDNQSKSTEITRIKLDKETIEGFINPYGRLEIWVKFNKIKLKC